MGSRWWWYLSTFSQRIFWDSVILPMYGLALKKFHLSPIPDVHSSYSQSHLIFCGQTSLQNTSGYSSGHYSKAMLSTSSEFYKQCKATSNRRCDMSKVKWPRNPPLQRLCLKASVSFWFGCNLNAELSPLWDFCCIQTKSRPNFVIRSSLLTFQVLAWHSCGLEEIILRTNSS